MPAKKNTAKKAAPKQKSFEGTLWHTADPKGDCPARSAIIKPKAILQSLTRQREIRQKLVENDLVDCMIALPGQLFYTTQIPVCLWFLTKNKKADSERDYRNREGETLFIDARKIGSMISRTQKELGLTATTSLAA
jgi:type I restriction enzyme M protein